MAQERCIRRCLASGRLWEVGDVRTIESTNDAGRPNIAEHFRLVGPDEEVADKEFHNPEKIAEIRRESGLLDKTAAIMRSLDQLDPDDNTHWTAKGYPSVAKMHLLTGFEVSKGDLQAAYPEFDRELARDLRGS